MNTEPTAPPRLPGELTMARRLQVLRRHTELTEPLRGHTMPIAAMSSAVDLAVRHTRRTREVRQMAREPNLTFSPSQEIAVLAGDSDREPTRHPDTSLAGLEGFAVQDADSAATDHTSVPLRNSLLAITTQANFRSGSKS